MDEATTISTSEKFQYNGEERTLTGPALATNVQTSITGAGGGFQIFGTRIQNAIRTLRGE